MSAPPAYAELHCLSNFTFLRGASHAEELVERAHALGYTALAITDECSLSGVVRAHQKAKALGLPLLIGCEVRLDDGPTLVLLACNRAGYGELCRLITHARRHADKGTYRLCRDDLDGSLNDCLALLPVALQTTDDEAGWLAHTFAGRAWLALELLRDGRDHDRLQHSAALAARHALPCVASGDVHMHVRGRRALQDLLTAIRRNTPVARLGHARLSNGERHLRTRDDLATLYPPALLAETLNVAARCTFSLDELRYQYPDDVTPSGMTPHAWLRQLTEQGIARRWPEGCPHKVRAQVEHELALIAELGYEAYFLTVWDMVRFAREHGILCQGRGSAANSAVCYCLGITEVDPARMNLLFERFISRERNEPPDIDVDFEHQRREEVIQYVYGKYGRERAALAATVICYRTRSALRDVGKALGLGLEQVEALISSVAAWRRHGELTPEHLAEAGFDPHNPTLERLVVLVNTLRGFPRHLSQHVGGFVIAAGRLDELVPIENASMPERTVIQWEKDDLEALGLLKVDVLALGMLSAIRRALDLLNGFHGLSAQRALTLASIPAEDPAVYAMIQRADTIGVFQIESRAQMSMLPRLRPACFYDLVVEVAIVRPGPIQGDMVHPYLRRRQGSEAVDYPSDAVRGVLERTLGVPIFQEQVIKLAMVAAGFTPGEADQLRRAMAAWKRRGGLEPYQKKLMDGMQARGYRREFAERVYRQILGFGDYGFPESHAASFALLVYVSSWLKHYHPAAFCAALINSQPMGFYAPAQLVRDAREHAVEVRPADVNHSAWGCSLEASAACAEPITAVAAACAGSPGGTSVSGRAAPVGQGAAVSPPAAHAASSSSVASPALRLGLCLIRGLSQAGAERIVAQRARAAFSDVQDLARRAQLKRPDLKALAAADALRGLAGHRHLAAWHVAGVEEALPLAALDRFSEQLPLLAPPSAGQAVLADYAQTGLTLHAHPLALIRDALRARGLLSSAEVGERAPGEVVHTAGLVLIRQRPGNGRAIFVTLEDEYGGLNLLIWADLAERQRRVLLGSQLLGVVAEIQRAEGVQHLVCRRLENHSDLLGGLNVVSRDFH
ncbi:MAG: error-prone DNA polymerase [Gammaproteobacteria bacterium]|nr:error-prone DNA polymerase [Gammaproteobacteria bacterium]